MAVHVLERRLPGVLWDLRGLPPIEPEYLDIAAEAITRGAIQKQGEFAQLLQLAAATKPKTIIEVGADKGGTLYGWSQLRPAPDVLAVDLPSGDFGQHTGLPDLHGAELIVGDSHHRSTIRKVEDWLGGRLADVVFIDGDHTLGGVTADFRNFRPLCRVGGLVVFHDILIHPWFAVGVAQLWEGIKDKWPHTEIITEPLSWGGIGVLTNTASPLPRRPVRVRRRPAGS